MKCKESVCGMPKSVIAKITSQNESFCLFGVLLAALKKVLHAAPLVRILAFNVKTLEFHEGRKGDRWIKSSMNFQKKHFLKKQQIVSVCVLFCRKKKIFIKEHIFCINTCDL